MGRRSSGPAVLVDPVSVGQVADSPRPSSLVVDRDDALDDIDALSSPPVLASTASDCAMTDAARASNSSRHPVAVARPTLELVGMRR